MGQGKFKPYKEQALKLYPTLSGNITSRSKQIADTLGFPYEEGFRVRLSEWIRKRQAKELNTSNYVDSILDVLTTDTTTETNQYESREVMTALDEQGKLMDIDAYCEFYGVPREQVKSYKLISHTGIPFYNIAFTDDEDLIPITAEDLKELIFSDLSQIEYKYNYFSENNNRPIVATVADLHFGAYVDNLIKTREFSIDILANLLADAAVRINTHESGEVHVHILGDLIESFTGLNHINSWKGLQKGMIGAEVIKLTAKVLHDSFLSKIYNLKSVKIISGNHDRVTANKTEDTDGDAANLIAWGLELIGYNVEYNAFVLTHLVDDVNYILLHGHDSISRKPTKDICWDYGKQGKFNFITEGHLHSIIEKLSVSQKSKYNTVKDDAVDHRRMNCPSLFTGNSYSERLGYTSNSGFIVSENNGKGVPNVYFYAL